MTVVLSWRPPQLRCYHGGLLDHSAIAVLRPPQPPCSHRCYPTPILSQRPANCGSFMETAVTMSLSWRPMLSWRLLQTRHYHKGCCKCGSIMEAAMNATLSQRLCKCGAITMAATTAALAWDGKKIKIFMVIKSFLTMILFSAWY